MKKINILLLTLLAAVGFLFQSQSLQAQVGIGILNPDSSAILHLETVKRGFIMPRMTVQQRDAIVNPADGLFIYNTTDSVGNFWNGQCWLPLYLEDCNDCNFDIVLNPNSGTIDRTVSDSIVTTANITQTNGNPQFIALAVVGQLPQDVTVTFSNNPVLSTGSSNITIKCTPFTPAGTYPIIIQALCGGKTKTVIYSLTIEPCYRVDVFNTGNNINMSTLLYQQNPTAPTNQPICVVCYIHPGVSVGSLSAVTPAFTTGNIPAGSIVAIYNEGDVIGRGGDGGIAYDPVQNLTGAGQDGGTAINLTIKSMIQNQGYIFGGGGGGASMAFSISQPLGPITLIILIGSGGGGGAGSGVGGQAPPFPLGLIFYAPGSNGTGGIFGVPGTGGLNMVPIPIGIGPVTITITPNTIGGNGGNYGAPGTQGSFNVGLNAVLNIPIIGQVTIFNGNIPLPVPAPAPGQGGYAVKRNGNQLTNIIDNLYNTAFLKGRVGN